MTSLRLKVIVGIAAAIGIFLVVSLVQEMNRRWQVQREVAALEEDVREAQRKTIELDQLNQYFRTDDYQERVARENLNYRAAGEKVVLIPEGAPELAVKSGEVPQEREVDSVPKKWWRIFFVDESPFAPAGETPNPKSQ